MINRRFSENYLTGRLWVCQKWQAPQKAGLDRGTGATAVLALKSALPDRNAELANFAASRSTGSPR